MNHHLHALPDLLPQELSGPGTPQPRIAGPQILDPVAALSTPEPPWRDEVGHLNGSTGGTASGGQPADEGNWSSLKERCRVKGGFAGFWGLDWA